MIEMTETGLPMAPSSARQATPRVIAVSATPLFRLGVSAAFAEERGAELVATAETTAPEASIRLVRPIRSAAPC